MIAGRHHCSVVFHKPNHHQKGNAVMSVENTNDVKHTNYLKKGKEGVILQCGGQSNKEICTQNMHSSVTNNNEIESCS